jgi:superfamily II DNA/RNA helicase
MHCTGYAVDTLHGDKTQNIRDRVMNDYRNGRVRGIYI